MEEIKWYQSKVIWAQIIGAGASIATALGVTVLTPEVQAIVVSVIVAVVTVVFRVGSKATIKV